jgi:hypothetical protein
VKTIALSDENDYIRYVAALSVSNDDKDEESVTVYRHVIKDPSNLVVSSQDHWSFSAFIFPSKPEQGVERFWRVPVPRRLAVAAEMLGSDLAACLKFAVEGLLPSGTVTSGELEDVVHEFIGSSRRSNRKIEVADLWHVVPYLYGPCTGSERGELSNIPEATLWNKFLSKDSLRICLDTIRPIGATDGKPTSFICFDIHFGAKLVHLYPVSEDEAKSIMGDCELFWDDSFNC